ncbi:unnamed protein product [Caenorhabditis angaria]|uniref:Secreted protein n=1 Tax=Caenorhabditis angaria TaxID=860376 RepID=A0A9P1MWZ2_9PELO|nr:unnamed protein product [Caenorhabditis angaria]
MFIRLILAILGLIATSTVLCAPGLFALPSKSLRSDPSVYEGYENSFYRGYGADQPFRFGQGAGSNW